MNDPVLNRKLFRHQAQIIHNKIPKLQEGGDAWYRSGAAFKKGWQKYPTRHLWDFNKGRMYNTAMLANPWKKARIAGGVAAMAGKKIFQKTGVPWAAKKAWPYTGIPKTVRGVKQAVRKYPTAAKIAGGAKIAAGVGLGWEGLTRGIDSFKQGKYGSAGMEIGGALWGGGIGMRGYRLFKRGQAAKNVKEGSRRGIGSFKKATKRAAAYERTPYLGAHSGKLMLGGAAGALAFEGEDAQTLKYDLTGVSETQLNEINNTIRKIAKDKASPTIDEANKAIQIWIDENKGKKQEGKQETKEEGAASTFEAEGTVPKSGSPVNPEEAKLLAAQKEENAKAEAGALKKEFDNSDMKTKKEFLEFRKSITDLTGTYGNDRDLILMKLASGMMGGTTPHKGLKGFLDVAGDAMGPTVDTALALSNAQKGRDNEVAMSFLKMKQEEAKAAEGGGIKLKGQLKTFLVKDPATADSRGSLYGQKVVTGQYDDNAGLIYEMGTNQTYELLQGEAIREAKGTGAQLQKSRSKLSSMAIGLDYVNHILFDMDDDLKGVTGWARLLASDWISESNTWSGMQNKYTQGADNIAKYVDNEILDPSLFTDREGRPKMTTIIDEDGKEREIRQYDWAVQHLQQEDAKDIKNAQDANRGWFGAQVSTEELDQLTKAALIENRLKYIIANANKSEDRLTRWDIENAEKNTSVLSFFSLKRRFSAAGVNSQMRALKDELQGNFDKEARNYQELGGTNDYLLSFNSVQRIREWNLAEEGKVPLDQTINVLESIQVPAALKEGGFVGA